MSFQPQLKNETHQRIYSAALLIKAILGPGGRVYLSVVMCL